MQGPKAWSEGDPSRSPSMMWGVNSHAPSNHLGRYAMYDLDGDGHVSMEEIVTATFKNLFPDSFQSVLEVRNHKVSKPGMSQNKLTHVLIAYIRHQHRVICTMI